jgi:NAD(P)-dependent dehydrogenase (short-subunit alcohol dehydrogenase family)
VAAVAATAEAEAAFGVQRLARRLASGERGVIAQAIDATNEAAVRVMVRQVSKELGGLDAVVFSCDFGPNTEKAFELTVKNGAREMLRRGRGVIVALDPGVRLPQMAVVSRQNVGEPVRLQEPDLVVSVVRNWQPDVARAVALVLDQMEVDLLNVAGEADSG